MHSFDLFNTLVASCDGSERAGDVPVEKLIPIAENIAKVYYGDLVISDFYDCNKAEYILRNICKLPNKLICTEDGKATGRVWEEYHPELHLGDNEQIDVMKARQCGINAQLTTLWKPKNYSQFELTLREARLTTWNDNPQLRGLQLHQIEKNFPFLLKVAFMLDTKMKAEGYTRLLLCSRDCYMLHILMTKLFKGYEIEYFYSNRLMRLYPTPEYLSYATSKIHDKTLIVDLCGSGMSLHSFCGKYGGKHFLVGCSANYAPHFIKGGLRETINVAPHPTITKWPMETDYTVKIETVVMIEALSVCVEIAIRNNLKEPDYSLEKVFWGIEDDRIKCLYQDHQIETAVMEKLLQDKYVALNCN